MSECVASPAVTSAARRLSAKLRTVSRLAVKTTDRPVRCPAGMLPAMVEWGMPRAADRSELVEGPDFSRCIRIPTRGSEPKAVTAAATSSGSDSTWWLFGMDVILPDPRPGVTSDLTVRLGIAPRYTRGETGR